MQHRRIAARMVHAKRILTDIGPHAGGESAGAVIHIPIEGFSADQPLRGGKPKRMHIGQEHQQTGKLNAATHDAKFRRLLDAVDGVATCIGKANHLGA